MQNEIKLRINAENRDYCDASFRWIIELDY